MLSFLKSALVAGALAGIVAPALAEDYKGKLQHSPWLALRFEQGGQYVPMKRAAPIRTEVTLDAAPFTIVLPVRSDDDVYFLTSWTDDSIFTAANPTMRAFKAKTEEHEPPQYFQPYTSMADTAAGSGTLMLNAQGHHYLSDLRLGPDYYRHVFHVASILGDDEAGKPKEYGLDEIEGPLYLVAWYDENGDEKMTHGEYEFLVLRLR